VTGYGQDDNRRSTRHAGFDHHITKPPDLELLLLLIATADVTRPELTR